MLTDLNKYLSWINSNIGKLGPIPKQKRHNQDLIIDEFSFARLIKMSTADIEKKIK